jgi:hypothetical protein
MRTTCMVMAAAVVLAGCVGNDGVGPKPGALAINGGSAELVEGKTIALSVTASGATINPNAVSWTSRDPSTVTVDGGVVRGVAAGPAWVVARQGEAVDSLQVTVRFSNLAPDGAAIRLLGSATAPMRLRGAGMMTQTIGQPISRTVLNASNKDVKDHIGDAWWGDTTLMIASMKPLVEGSLKIAAFKVTTDQGFGWGGGNGVILRIREGSSKFKFYVAVDSSPVVIRASSFPAEPGLTPGLITGSVTFEAAGIQFDVNDKGEQVLTPIGTTTTTVYAEFSTPVWHVLHPYITATYNGVAPYTGTASAGGHGDIIGGALGVKLWTFLGIEDPSLPPDNMTVGEGWVWVPQPRVGTFALDSVGPSRMTDSTSGAAPWAWIKFVPGTAHTLPLPWHHSFSERGTLNITTYRGPTAKGFGEVRGTLTTMQRFWRNGAATSDTTTATIDFILPITPLDGSPFPRNGGGG